MDRLDGSWPRSRGFLAPTAPVVPVPLFRVIIGRSRGGRGRLIPDPAHDDAFHVVALGRGSARLDHAGLRIDGEGIAGGDAEREDRLLLIPEGLLADGDRQISGNVALAVGRFVAVLLRIPGEDPDL